MIPTEFHLPDDFIRRLQAIVPDNAYEACLASFAQPSMPCIRVNTLKGEPNEILAQLATLEVALSPVNWLANSYQLAHQNKTVLSQSNLHEQGLIYFQNLSSMVPVLHLAPQAHETILDLTAAPGSKTLQIATLMKNTGWISAVENVKARFFKLKDNLKTQGASNVHTYLMDGARVWSKCPEHFDRVLLDAPCSTESRFQLSKPASYAYWSERKIKEMATKQRKLIYSAVQSLKPGGTLIYSTCSFAPEENEAIIHAILHKFPQALTVEAIELPFTNWQAGLSQWKKKSYNPQVTLSRRILPTDGMEAFFLCQLKKTESTIDLNIKNKWAKRKRR